MKKELFDRNGVTVKRVICHKQLNYGQLMIDYDLETLLGELGEANYKNDRNLAKTITELIGGVKVYEVRRLFLSKGDGILALPLTVISTYHHTYVVQANFGGIEWCASLIYEVDGEETEIRITSNSIVRRF